MTTRQQRRAAERAQTKAYANATGNQIGQLAANAEKAGATDYAVILADPRNALGAAYIAATTDDDEPPPAAPAGHRTVRADVRSTKKAIQIIESVLDANDEQPTEDRLDARTHGQLHAARARLAEPHKSDEVVLLTFPDYGTEVRVEILSKSFWMRRVREVA